MHGVPGVGSVSPPVTQTLVGNPIPRFWGLEMGGDRLAVFRKTLRDPGVHASNATRDAKARVEQFLSELPSVAAPRRAFNEAVVVVERRQRRMYGCPVTMS